MIDLTFRIWNGNYKGYKIFIICIQQYNCPCIEPNKKGAYSVLYLFCSLVYLNIVVTCYSLDFFDILSVTAMRCCNYKVLKQAIKLRPYLTLSLKSNSMVIELNILNIIPQLQLLHHKSDTLYPYTAMTPKIWSIYMYIYMVNGLWLIW